MSAPQPPGSTFKKIITLSAALQQGIAIPSGTYPISTFTTLSGVKLLARQILRAALNHS